MMNPQTAATIRDAYTRWSTTYDQDRNLTRDLDARVTRDLLGEHRVSTVLELGCGTGKNSRFFTRIAERVVAVDFSAGMIRVARARVGPAARVSFVMADISEPWPLARRSVDLISINLVLEHIPALGPVFGEAARVLRPGGRLFICELHPARQYQGKRAVFRRGVTTTEIPAFVHHISSFPEPAGRRGLALLHLREWWHDEDRPEQPPRLVSFLFTKSDTSEKGDPR